STPDTPNNSISQTALEAQSATANVVLEATGQITVGSLTNHVLNLAQNSSGSFRMTSTTSGGITFLNATDTIQTAGGAITLQAQGMGALTNIGNLTSNGGQTTLESAGPSNVPGNISAGGGAV